MIRPISILCLVLVVMLAGCGAGDINTQPAQVNTSTQSPADGTPETTSSTPDPAVTESPTPTPTPSPEPITFALQNAPNETLAEEQLQAAIERWRSSEMVSQRIKLTDEVATADYRIIFRPTIKSCQGDKTETTFYWCLEENSDTVEVASRYIPGQQAELTERAAGAALVGQDYEGASFYDEIEEPQIDTPFLESGPITVAATSESNDIDATEYAALRDALSYWNKNASRYDTAWQAQFEIINDTRRADVEVRFVEDIQRCANSSDALGCAPIIGANEQITSQARIRIEEGYAKQSAEVIIQHEFGHLLGLVHGQEPLPLMSATYDAQLAGNIPNVDTRDYGFDDSVLPVYVDYETFEADQERVREEIVQTMEWYEDGNVESVPNDIRFTFTEEIDEAAFVLRYNQTVSDDGFAYRIQPYGRSVDTDEAIEYYSTGIFRFGGDTDTLSYYFAEGSGYMIANTATLDDAPPDGVRESEYEEWPE